MPSYLWPRPGGKIWKDFFSRGVCVRGRAVVRSSLAHDLGGREDSGRRIPQIPFDEDEEMGSRRCHSGDAGEWSAGVRCTDVPCHAPIKLSVMPTDGAPVKDLCCHVQRSGEVQRRIGCKKIVVSVLVIYPQGDNKDAADLAMLSSPIISRCCCICRWNARFRRKPKLLRRHCLFRAKSCLITFHSFIPPLKIEINPSPVGMRRQRPQNLRGDCPDEPGVEPET